MNTRDGHIVLVAGYAPYLGGAATWEPLRDAAPQLQFVEVDLLEISDLADPMPAARESVVKALQGARAIVAHGNAATIAVEAVAIANPSIPVLLLSPQLLTRSPLLLRAVRAFAGGIGAPMFTAFARSKLRKLANDESYVRKQLRLLVRDDAISDGLFREACQRISDPRMDIAVARTVETVRATLTPIDAKANAAVLRRETLFGNGPLDRKAIKRSPGTLVDGARSAPMLETPKVVAEHLYRLLT